MIMTSPNKEYIGRVSDRPQYRPTHTYMHAHTHEHSPALVVVPFVHDQFGY